MKKVMSTRLLIAFYAVIGIALVVLAILAAVMPGSVGETIDMIISSTRNSVLLQSLYIFICLVVAVWSLAVIYFAIRPERRGDKGSVPLQKTENGTVRVAVAALDTLVKEAVGQVEGMLEIKTRIINNDDSISVRIDMSLAGDVHIPNVTMLMQRNIKTFVEEYSGIAVRDVEIMIESIRTSENVQIAIERREPVILAEPEPAPEPVVDTPLPDLTDEKEGGLHWPGWLRKSHAEAGESTESDEASATITGDQWQGGDAQADEADDPDEGE